MSSVTDQIVSRILGAALILFARHGFQRTSMADVASEARISRATLYVRFRDKSALFKGLATLVVTDALAAAEAAWMPGANLADNLEATILAKDLPLYRVLHASPHGAELLAVDAELTQAQAKRLDEGFVALLAQRASDAAAQGADLSAFNGSDGFGAFIATAGAGLKHENRTEAEYRAAVRRLCVVTARATIPLVSAKEMGR
jgi:AcrR family transcriptional regulator